ncbi:hypothetical protein Tco_0478212 [Tanacetum coccineum]
MERLHNCFLSLDTEQDMVVAQATARTSATRKIELIATIDGQEKTITKASLRIHLKLEDNGGVTTLPNSEIFEQLALMGYATDSDKLTFQKATAIICLQQLKLFNILKFHLDAGTLQPHTKTYSTPDLTTGKSIEKMKRVINGYSGEDIPLFASMITASETSPSRITSSPSLSPQHTPFTAPSTSQPSNIHTTPVTEEAASMPHESPLQSVHSLGRDEGSLSLHELTVLCTNLSNKVTSLEAELAQTKQTYGTALTKLIKKVKKLEQTVKTSQSRRRTRVVLSDEEEVSEDPSKQGRSLIEELDLDADISLVPPHDAEIQEKISDDTEVLLEEEETTELIEEPTELVEDQGSAEVDTAHVIDWNDPSVIRYHALQNRPRSVVEVKKNMLMYLKNQGGYKMKDFKGMSYDDIRPIFEKECDQVHSFVPMDSEEEVQRLKIGWEVYSKDTMDDLVKLWSLVQERYNSSGLTEDKEIELWVELKMLFEPDAENLLELQKYTHDPLKWWLYDMCAVHHVSTEKGQDIFILVEKDYPLRKGLATLMLYQGTKVNTGSPKLSTARPKLSTDSTKIESMKLEAMVEERRIFKCWFHYHTTNGHQFTMSNRHQELASPEQTAPELASPKQTALGKDISNPLIVDSLLKTIWLSMHHVIAMKHWLFQSKRLLTKSLDLSRLATTLNKLERSIHSDQQRAAKPKVITTAATTITTTRPKARGVVVQEPSEFRTTTSSLQPSQPSKTKDKGKAIMIELEVPLKKKDQVALDEEMARNLEAQLQDELIEEERLARKKEEEANISLIKSWENTQAMIEADRLLAERLQTREQEELTDEEKAKLFMEFMEKRRKHFAALRAQEKRKRPPTKTQKRNQMSIYLKHMGGYKHNQLKGRSYDEIQKLFDKEMKRVNSFVAMNSEAQEISGKKDESSSKKAEIAQDSSAKRAGDKLESDKSKKQKTDENEEVEVDNEAELKKHMVTVKDDDIAIDAIPLATKPPVIVEYKLIREGIMGLTRRQGEGSSV